MKPASRAYKGRLASCYSATADRYRSKLNELLGEERGKDVKTAEAFEVCEYGSQPTREDLLRIFPFYGNR